MGIRVQSERPRNRPLPGGLFHHHHAAEYRIPGTHTTILRLPAGSGRWALHGTHNLSVVQSLYKTTMWTRQPAY